MLNEDFILKLIRRNEDKTLDFKQKITSKEKIAKTISSMANTEGGLILIGISDQKKVVGIDPAEEMYMVESANETFCDPPSALSFEEITWKDYSGSLEQEVEKSLLLVKIDKSRTGKIRIWDKHGEAQVYVRVNDRTVSIT